MGKLLLGIVLGFIIAAFVVLGLVYNNPRTVPSLTRSYSYSDFVTAIDDGKIHEVVFRGASITGRFRDGSPFETLAPHTQLLPALTDRLLASKVIVIARPAENDPSEIPAAVSAVIAWLPLLVTYALFFIGLWRFVARPVMALARQLEEYTKATHSAGRGNSE
jgi:cell division protease FtsH